MDLSVPVALPLVEVLPAMADHLGALDAARAHGGYSLMRSDGSTLAPDLSLEEQGVADGDMFTLVLGAASEPARVYDDIVEAVGDSTVQFSAPWSPTDAAATAQGAAVALLGSAAIVVGLGEVGVTALALAGGGLLIAAAGGTVVARMGMAKGGAALMLTAALFAAVLARAAAAMFAPGWEWVAASGGLALGGALGAAVLPAAKEAMIVPVAAGLALGVASAASRITDWRPLAVWAITAAVAGSVTNAIPWFAMSASRIKAVTPFTTAEILDDQPLIDAAEVRRRYSLGQRVGLALRCAAMAVALVALPTLAKGGIAAFAEATALFVGLLLSSRQAYSRIEVGIVGVVGIGGLALTAFLTSLAHPQWRPWLVSALAAAGAATVALALLGRARGTGVGRLADALDMVALVSLLPLAVVIAGLA